MALLPASRGPARRGARKPARRFSPPPGASSPSPVLPAPGPTPLPPPPASTRRSCTTTSTSKDRLYLAVLEDQFREFNRQAVALLTGAGLGARGLAALREPAFRYHQPEAPLRPAAPAAPDGGRQVNGGAGAQILLSRAARRWAGCWSAGCARGSSAGPTSGTPPCRSSR